MINQPDISPVRLFAFTLLRNGVKYDYPFRESLLSLAPLVEKIYLSLGKCDDGTLEVVNTLPNLHILPTVWDESLRQGGLILSQQTNWSLDHLRQDFGDLPHTWGIYLQGDEVIHEAHYETIRKDLQLAQEQGCDAVSFRFLHFWQNHNQIAINKKWYPQEIRAVKLSAAKIESWGDAQSFRNASKIFVSDVPIFHYGHVREKSSYQKKKGDILKLYHSDGLLNKYQRREKKLDNQTQCLPFYGLHPQVMKERIEKLQDTWLLPEQDHVILVGKKEDFPDSIENLQKKIHAKKVTFTSSLSGVARTPGQKIIICKSGWFPRLLSYPHRIPQKMKSKLARPWSKEFFLLLKLSAKSVGFKEAVL